MHYFGGLHTEPRLFDQGPDCGNLKERGMFDTSVRQGMTPDRVQSEASGQVSGQALVHALIERFDARLRRYIGRALAPHDTEDALQDVYARLVRLSQKVPPPDFNVVYVFKTADSVLRDLYRRRKSHEAGQHVELEETLSTEAPSPFDELRWRQNADLLRQAIRGLNSQERIVLMMHRIEGLKLTEISQKQRIPLRTVQRLLADALAKCRHTLRDSGWYEI